MDNTQWKKQYGSIRSSPVILVMQLISISFVLSISYSIIEVILLNLKIPSSLHHHLIWSIFVVHLLKNLLLTYIDSLFVIKWITTTYTLKDKQLVKRAGILNITEKTYDLRNIRNISIYQSFIGKLFNYGDLTIMTSASGGYQDEIYLQGISNPAQYKSCLQGCIRLK